MSLIGRPRIAYLVQQFPPEVGAGPARVTEMAERWIATGAEVTVITGIPSSRLPENDAGASEPTGDALLLPEESWSGIRVLRSWLYRNRGPGIAATLVNNLSFMLTSLMNALVRLGNTDVIIASAPPFFPLVTGVLLSKILHVPLVLEIRDLWPDYLVGMGVIRADSQAGRLLFGLEAWLLTSARHVVVVTESFRSRVIAKGVPADAVTVIPNGVDSARYFRSDTSLDDLPVPALARADGEFLVGYLGTFGAGQQLQSVVDAAAIVTTVDASVRFVLVGDGPRRRDVTGRLQELRLSNVSVHPPIAKDRTRSFYNACDACLVPLAPILAFQETIPSKIFEVMACERVVIASADGEAKAIVDSSGGGVVVRPGDAKGIADAVLHVRHMTPLQRAAIGKAGRAFVVANYQRGKLAERYLELLVKVASGAS